MFIIDTHCHLDRLFFGKYFKDIYQYLFYCQKNYIKYILVIAVSIENFIKNFYMFSGIPHIGFTCGIHPLYCLKVKNRSFLKKFSLYKKVVALGETGLDFKNKVNVLFKDKQIDNFIYHLSIAKQVKKPIIIHSRNAYYETLDILKQFDISYFGGLVHCFSYTKKKFLSNFLDLGLFISISGLITFKNNLLLRKVIQYVPLDRLLIETDSPYLSPEPFRGLINHPARILNIIQNIADIKNITLLNLINIYLHNFSRLFNIKFF